MSTTRNNNIIMHKWGMVLLYLIICILGIISFLEFFFMKDLILQLSLSLNQRVGFYEWLIYILLGLNLIALMLLMIFLTIILKKVKNVEIILKSIDAE
ncbi:MAG: hypothetical protein ACFFDH_05395 [Promethearchaeota archaeon]